MRKIRTVRASSSTKMPHILIVEDNPLVQETLQVMLKNLGCASDLANTGQEALDRLDRNPYDAVFIDVILPDMCGITLIKQLRQLQKQTDLKILVMTAYLSSEIRENCLNAGANVVSTKKDLVKNIKEYLKIVF